MAIPKRRAVNSTVWSSKTRNACVVNERGRQYEERSKCRSSWFVVRTVPTVPCQMVQPLGIHPRRMDVPSHGGILNVVEDVKGFLHLLLWSTLLILIVNFL